MLDLFGQALLDFQTNQSSENLMTETNISELDEMEVSYLFRTFSEMPLLEQKALEMSKGKVLDVGCGAGSHSLYLQNHKNLNVYAIDISEKAIQTCLLRGLKNAATKNILDLELSKNDPFDTILLLMNGTGIFGTLQEVPQYLKKLKSLLKPNGQILIDSSDLIYMFDTDDDGGTWLPGNKYYGELTFSISYKNQVEAPLNWLYLDFELLSTQCETAGLRCEKIQNGSHYDYLARITVKI